MPRHYASKAHASIIHGSKEHKEMKMKNSGHEFSIPEDESAVAMMPQSVVYRAVNSPYHSLPEEYEDTPAGVDAQIMDDNKQMMKGFKPTKV
jgi:hypothetical protein